LWPNLKERAPCPPPHRQPATLLSLSVAAGSDLQERKPPCSRPPVRPRHRAARPLLYAARPLLLQRSSGDDDSSATRAPPRWGDIAAREHCQRPRSGRSASTCIDPRPASATPATADPHSGSGFRRLEATSPLPAVHDLGASTTQRQGHDRRWDCRGVGRGVGRVGRARGGGGEESAAWWRRGVGGGGVDQIDRGEEEKLWGPPDMWALLSCNTKPPLKTSKGQKNRRFR
jgi:hypothetical protein